MSTLDIKIKQSGLHVSHSKVPSSESTEFDYNLEIYKLT